jgi:hypothetical protein
MPFLVRCLIGINCVLDLIFPANLSLGRNYAEFPNFYLKPPGVNMLILLFILKLGLELGI